MTHLVSKLSVLIREVISESISSLAVPPCECYEPRVAAHASLSDERESFGSERRGCMTTGELSTRGSSRGFYDTLASRIESFLCG